MWIQSECCSRNNFHSEFATQTEKNAKKGVAKFKTEIMGKDESDIF